MDYKNLYGLYGLFTLWQLGRRTFCNVFTLNPKNSPKYPFFGQFSVLNHAFKSFNLKDKESKPISQCPKFIQVQHHANLNRKALHFQSSDKTFCPPRYHQLWLLGPTWASCAPAGTPSHTQPIRKTSAYIGHTCCVLSPCMPKSQHVLSQTACSFAASGLCCRKQLLLIQ